MYYCNIICVETLQLHLINAETNFIRSAVSIFFSLLEKCSCELNNA